MIVIYSSGVSFCVACLALMGICESLFLRTSNRYRFSRFFVQTKWIVGERNHVYIIMARNLNVFSSFDKTRRLYFIIAFMLIFTLIARLFATIRYALSFNYDSYGYSEFLINFHGGYVRRGLAGELLHEICQYTGIEPGIIIFIICVCAYLLVTYFFLKKFKSNGYCWFLVLSPLFCGYVIDIIRKDYVQYCLFIAMMIWLAHGKTNGIKLAALVVISSFGMMLHEAFIFWGLPVIALLLFDGNIKSKKGICFSAIIIAIFLLQSMYHGTQGQALTIVESWQELLGNDAVQVNWDNSIGAIGWDTVSTVVFHWKLNFWRIYGLPTFFLRIAEFAGVYYLIVNFLWAFRRGTSFDEESHTNLSVLFLFSLFCLSPMFIFLSCDYGRLYQYAIVSTFTAFLLLPKEHIRRLLPHKIFDLTALLNRRINRVVVPTKGIMILFLILFCVSPAWYAPQRAIGESVYVSFFTGIYKGLKLIKMMLL